MKSKIDYILWVVVLLLAIFGLVMIYSASCIWAEYKFDDPFKFVKAQALFFLIGLILISILAKFDHHIFYKKANMILFVVFCC